MNKIRIKVLRIYERMDALMLTTAELAEYVGISAQGMSGILNSGICAPTTAGKLSWVLGIPVWELIA